MKEIDRETTRKVIYYEETIEKVEQRRISLFTRR
jgi:hypothetical protein